MGYACLEPGHHRGMLQSVCLRARVIWIRRNRSGCLPGPMGLREERFYNLCALLEFVTTAKSIMMISEVMATPCVFSAMSPTFDHLSHGSVVSNHRAFHFGGTEEPEQSLSFFAVFQGTTELRRGCEL